MGESKEMATPMESNLKLKKDEGKPLKDAKKFLTACWESDLLYHHKARDLILCWCCCTIYAKSKELSFRCCKEDLALYWAGDSNDRRSTTGYCFDIGSAVVSLCSKKQDTVALSSSEAEYVAATMAAQECVWLKRLIGDMLSNVDYPVPIKCAMKVL
ncbi:hypothetical protein SASPL_132126 [Salvia splendens]|uniref:Uncharacterized protein n=1 Tax=Salvia splendens TaxID=180675 RepID=A0A8X8ZM99_SALSN|nr:hypothetical protein SASPL_132126 [Salvia splendens]